MILLAESLYRYPDCRLEVVIIALQSVIIQSHEKSSSALIINLIMSSLLSKSLFLCLAGWIFNRSISKQSTSNSLNQLWRITLIISPTGNSAFPWDTRCFLWAQTLSVLIYLPTQKYKKCFFNSYWNLQFIWIIETKLKDRAFGTAIGILLDGKRKCSLHHMLISGLPSRYC